MTKKLKDFCVGSTSRRTNSQVSKHVLREEMLYTLHSPMASTSQSLSPTAMSPLFSSKASAPPPSNQSTSVKSMSRCSTGVDSFLNPNPESSKGKLWADQIDDLNMSDDSSDDIMDDLRESFKKRKAGESPDKDEFEKIVSKKEKKKLKQILNKSN